MPILFDEIRHFYSKTKFRLTQPWSSSPPHRLLCGSIHSYAAIPVEQLLAMGGE